MKAYTYISHGKFELIDKPKPELQSPRDAIVRIALGSICTRDLHILPYLGKLNWAEICDALGEIDYQGDFTYEIGAPWAKWMDDGMVEIQARYLSELGHHLISEIDAARPAKA